MLGKRREEQKLYLTEIVLVYKKLSLIAYFREGL